MQIARIRYYHIDRRGILGGQGTFQLSYKFPTMAQHVHNQGSQDVKQGFYQRHCSANATTGSIAQAGLASGSLLGKMTRNYESTGNPCHLGTQSAMGRWLEASKIYRISQEPGIRGVQGPTSPP